MTRWIFAAALVLAAGCNKPSDSDCRKAIRNMQRLLGTDKLHSAQNVDAAVRSCRGASKKASVECAIQAQTLEALQACPFWHEQGMKDKTPAPGSGSAAAPAAGAGAATGAAAGSGAAAAAAAGSGSGAAPAGSGSGAGSSSGSGS